MLQRLVTLKSFVCRQKNLMKIRSFAPLTGLSLLQFSSTTVVAFVPPSSLLTAPTLSSSSTTAVGFLPTTTTTTASTTTRRFHRTSVAMSERKAGVASPEELKTFVADAGDKLLVVDVRNPDASVEPGDQKSLAVAALPSDTNRPQAQHLIWDRNADSMPLPDVPKDTPIITHCGGGGRGQKAKDFLEKNGFTKVLNGGGPKETDCWAEFGDK